MNDSSQRRHVARHKLDEEIPFWEVGDDAVWLLRWRCVSELGLCLEDDHDECRIN